jgi:hypothetical protein
LEMNVELRHIQVLPVLPTNPCRWDYPEIRTGIEWIPRRKFEYARLGSPQISIIGS